MLPSQTCSNCSIFSGTSGLFRFAEPDGLEVASIADDHETSILAFAGAMRRLNPG